MTALEQLADRIRRARELQLIPKEWDELAQTALAEVRKEWRSEKTFRLETGASDKWCRQHFHEYQEQGMARLNDRGRREWHRHARLPKQQGVDAESVKHDIVDSFRDRRSAVG